MTLNESIHRGAVFAWDPNWLVPSKTDRSQNLFSSTSQTSYDASRADLCWSLERFIKNFVGDFSQKWKLHQELNTVFLNATVSKSWSTIARGLHEGRPLKTVIGSCLAKLAEGWLFESTLHKARLLCTFIASRMTLSMVLLLSWENEQRYFVFRVIFKSATTLFSKRDPWSLTWTSAAPNLFDQSGRAWTIMWSIFSEESISTSMTDNSWVPKCERICVFSRQMENCCEGIDSSMTCEELFLEDEKQQGPDFQCSEDIINITV